LARRSSAAERLCARDRRVVVDDPVAMLVGDWYPLAQQFDDPVEMHRSNGHIADGCYHRDRGVRGNANAQAEFSLGAILDQAFIDLRIGLAKTTESLPCTKHLSLRVKSKDTCRGFRRFGGCQRFCV